VLPSYGKLSLRRLFLCRQVLKDLNAKSGSRMVDHPGAAHCPTSALELATTHPIADRHHQQRSHARPAGGLARARSLSGKTLPGWALWCSGAPSSLWAPTLPTLTASYGIGRLFGVSHHLATLKRRRLKRGHRWQPVHDRPEPGVGFGLKAAMPSRRDEIADRVIAGIAQGPHQGFRLVEMAHPIVTPMRDMNGDVPQSGDMVENSVGRHGREYSCYRDSPRCRRQGIRH
jgi:hypothetical protein